MTAHAETTHTPEAMGWRIARWGAVAAVLLLPAVAMQFTSEVNWTPFDFVVAGGMLGGAALVYEMAAIRRGPASYRHAAAIAIAASVLLVWVNGAVGVIGSEANPANLMYAGVLGVALVGSVLAGFRARGMALAMAATAAAQVVVAAVALITDVDEAGPNWLMALFGSTGIFTAMWLLSAALFQRASRS